MANMDLMALLSTIVLVATISTTIFAIAAYVVSRGYNKRKNRAKAPLIGKETAVAIAHKKSAPAARQTPILKRYNPFDVS